MDMQSQPYDPYEDEIELMDYLKVLWKWKYLDPDWNVGLRRGRSSHQSQYDKDL